LRRAANGGPPLAEAGPAPTLRIVATLGAGLLASLAAAFWLPLAPEDPLGGTLAALPLLLAALHAVHRWGMHRGGRRLGRAGTAGELAALGVLAAGAVGRPALGLPYAAEALAAGLLLVLGHRLMRQLLALRPLLGRRLGRRPPALFFWLPLTAYLAILPWSAAHHQPDGDEPYNLLVTHSLAYDGDADLANNYAAGDWRRFMERPIAPQPGDPVGHHGEIYSRHNALLPLALVPAYRLAGRAGAQVMMALLTAALAWLTLRLGRHYAAGRPGEALAACGLMALGPPLVLYSYQIWVEVPAAVLTLLALDAILDLAALAPSAPLGPAPGAGTAGGAAAPLPDVPAAAPADGAHRRWRVWAAILLPVVLLPLLKIRFILIAVPLVALAGWEAARQPRLRRRVAALALLLAALVGGILLYNQHLFSNPLKIHDLAEIDPSRHTWLDYLAGGLGLFYDAAFGLFGLAPLWLLVLPGLALLIARRHPLPAHLAVLVLPYLMIVVPRGEWYGGWSPPFRYALIALPLLALGLVPLLATRHRPGARALLGGLGALTLVLTLCWLVVPGWTYNFADGRTHLLDELSGRLGADVARFFPSSVRPRAATWIWPPVSTALVLGAWWLPGRRRRARGGEASGEEAASGAGAARPGAALAGVAAVLAAAALLPIAAWRLPTRVIEMEDPQVVKSGGELYPERWVVERTRYRGGWVLPVGSQIRAPVVQGGGQVRITLTGELVRNQPVPFTLELAAGGQLLALWTPVRDRSWESLTLGPFSWPAGAPLVLTARGPTPPGPPNGAVLDRIDLAWE
jgi:hypothetical protein